MEASNRRHRMAHIHDQENVYAVKGKGNLAQPMKTQGLSLRGALGDINTNVQYQLDVNVGKVACATAEFEKKATLNRKPIKCNYSHVQSKIDTGLAAPKPDDQPARPLLRREESTAGLANRAVARTKTQNEKVVKNKESVNIYMQTKKTESRKVTKLPGIKENKVSRVAKPIQKEPVESQAAKPTLKEPIESLGKLKLAEEQTSIIDRLKLKNHAAQLHDVLDTSSDLPDDIEDIDLGDKKSPMLMSIYIKDIYRYLTELEVKYPIQPDHLGKQAEITGRMRATLIDWLVEVQRQFSLVLETLHLTVGIIDRYLQAVPNLKRNQLQLVGVTAMFIASKYEEIYAPDINDFVYVTDKAYSKADIFRCEREMMSKLGFCLARPIPLSFLRRFVKAAHGNAKNHHLAKYLVDLSLVEYSMAHYRPSELAAAAICLSLFLLSSKELEEVWTRTMTYYSGYSLGHLLPIIKKIAGIVINISESKYKAVYNKYSEVSLAKVATLPQLKSDVIKELASP